MLLIILRLIFGYVKAEVYGFAPERFMNLIIKNEIVIWNVENTEKGYIFCTGRHNLILMKPYLQKTNMKIKILEKFGLPYAIKKYKRRTAFFLGFVLCGALLYILSIFVWEVKVTGENHLVADTILRQVEENYVKLGTLKSQIDCDSLEDALRNDFDEISWVSCELKGTVLTIYLEEGMSPNYMDVKDVNGDLIASKDANITQMITRVGTPMVRVKDSVKAGDVLISGTVYIYDDNNEVLETSYIKADGDVYGTTKYPYEDYVELQYYEKQFAEKSNQYISLFFMDYCFTPFIPKMKAKNYDTYIQIHKLKIFDNFYLPFGYKVITRTPYQLSLKKHDETEAKNILQEHMEKQMQHFTEKGIEIIENDVKIDKVEGKIVAKGDFTINEPIAIFKKAAGNTLPEQEK